MTLDELKKVIDSELDEVKGAGEIKSYFVVLGYDYPHFSVHMDISSRQLASMFSRASKDCPAISSALFAAAALMYKRRAEQEGGKE